MSITRKVVKPFNYHNYIIKGDINMTYVVNSDGTVTRVKTVAERIKAAEENREYSKDLPATEQ